jgi:hypothetical protein
LLIQKVEGECEYTAVGRVHHCLLVHVTTAATTDTVQRVALYNRTQTEISRHHYAMENSAIAANRVDYDRVLLHVKMKHDRLSSLSDESFVRSGLVCDRDELGLVIKAGWAW